MSARSVLTRALDGEGAAIEELIAELTPPLLRAVRAMLGPEHPDVEDLVQDTLIDLVDALPSFRGECTLLHFAIRIAARKASSSRKRARAGRGFVDRFWRREAPLQAAVVNPREASLVERRRQLLDSLLAELPQAQAETMLLRSVLGYSLEEVAAMTRVPLNTVRSRMRLAKETLRRRIETDEQVRELLGGEL
ncbi:MAG TPA: sigma-70 family RNA polymerase sigma factor [Polyangiaceae bacterium]|nr:sigma-70 family RNA polymerase sigma factor [Polyangiaceae bacterium]